MKLKFVLTVVLSLIIGQFTHAQSNKNSRGYLRWDLAQVRPIFEDKEVSVCYGLGYDRVTSNRTMWGASLYSSYGLIQNLDNGLSEEVPFLSSQGPARIIYDARSWMVGLSIHSDYSLSDINGFHVFIGPTTGVLMIRYTEELRSIQYANGDSDYLGDLNGSTSKTTRLVVPLGLRLGVRAGNYISLYGGGGLYLGQREKVGNAEIQSPGMPVQKGFYEVGFAWLIGNWW